MAATPPSLMRDDPAMIKLQVLIGVAGAALGVAACGGGDSRTVTVAPAETSAERTSTSPAVPGGDAMLIETRVTDARRHTGKVLGGSVIGESAFCRGGTTSGGSEGPTITTTFHCPGGTLKVQYAPTQRSLVQGAVWGVVSGTGTFKGLRGGGSMVAKFESDDPDRGRETFTGTGRQVAADPCSAASPLPSLIGRSLPAPRPVPGAVPRNRGALPCMELGTPAPAVGIPDSPRGIP